MEYASPGNINIQKEILARVSDYCGKPVTNHTIGEDDAPAKHDWTFYHSFFFAFIICSTVGYGNISPHNTFGRMFLIIYALIGIPVNGFLFAYLGDFFGKTVNEIIIKKKINQFSQTHIHIFVIQFIGVYKRYKSYKMATTKNYVPQRFTLIGRILLYLIPGIVIFIFLPSCLFTYIEGWPYSVSIYYSFVTLTTIGFGDFVPTFHPYHVSLIFVQFLIYYTKIVNFFYL